MRGQRLAFEPLEARQMLTADLVSSGLEPEPTRTIFDVAQDKTDLHDLVVEMRGAYETGGGDEIRSRYLQGTPTRSIEQYREHFNTIIDSYTAEEWATFGEAFVNDQYSPFDDLLLYAMATEGDLSEPLKFVSDRPLSLSERWAIDSLYVDRRTAYTDSPTARLTDPEITVTEDFLATLDATSVDDSLVTDSLLTPAASTNPALPAFDFGGDGTSTPDGVMDIHDYSILQTYFFAYEHGSPAENGNSAVPPDPVDPMFDLNLDNRISRADMYLWLERWEYLAETTLLDGDVDLDGFVDVGSDIFTFFANFTGPGPFGLLRQQGDVEYSLNDPNMQAREFNVPKTPVGEGDIDVNDNFTIFNTFTGPLSPGETGPIAYTPHTTLETQVYNRPDVIHLSPLILGQPIAYHATYELTNNNNSFLVTPTLTDSYIELSYANGVSGTADLLVTATDLWGNKLTIPIDITVDAETDQHLKSGLLDEELELATNTLASWRLTESSNNAVDWTGNGYDLTEIGTVESTTGAAQGGAREFDGRTATPDGHFEISPTIAAGESNPFSLTTTGFSAFGWFKDDLDAANDATWQTIHAAEPGRVLAGKTTTTDLSGPDDEWLLLGTGDSLQFLVRDDQGVVHTVTHSFDDNTSPFEIADTYYDDAWHFVAFGFDANYEDAVLEGQGGSTWIQVDGGPRVYLSEQSDTYITPPLTATDTEFTLGARGGVSTDRGDTMWAGELDEWGLYGGVLATSQFDYLRAMETVTTAVSGAASSLQSYVTQSNSNDDISELRFDIEGAAAHVLTVAAAADAITLSNPLIINAQTQPDASGLTRSTDQPAIELTESSASDFTGITITSDDVAVRGLAITDFDNEGIVVNGADRVLIQANHIGTDGAAVANRGSGSHGIHITQSNDVLVGSGLMNDLVSGTLLGSGANVIAYSGGDGVYIESGTGNAVSTNSLHTNAGLSIDLGADGVLINDEDDVDTGANELTNAPLLRVYDDLGGGQYQIYGMLNGAAGGLYRIEFYSSSTAYGEGETYLGSQIVQMAGGGFMDFDATVSSNSNLSAIAIGLNDAAGLGNTSEFSGQPVHWNDGGNVQINTDWNNSWLADPSGSQEEHIDDDPTEGQLGDPSVPGSFIPLSTGDGDGDGVPDYMDGYNLDGVPNNADDINENPLVLNVIQLSLPAGIDPTQALLSLVYSASDPMLATVEEPAPGHLRVWTVDSHSTHKGTSIDHPTDPGNFVPSGELFTWEQLGGSLEPNSDGSYGPITLYVEAVRMSPETESGLMGQQQIALVVSPDGSNPFPAGGGGGGGGGGEGGGCGGVQLASGSNAMVDTVNFQAAYYATASATDAIAMEKSPDGFPVDDGQFVISRGEGNITGDLIVRFKLIQSSDKPDENWAKNGGDYTVNGHTIKGDGTITIPNGQSSVTLTITPLDDETPEWDELVRIEVISSPPYMLTITIPETNVDYPPSESEGSPAASGSPYSGNATNGSLAAGPYPNAIRPYYFTTPPIRTYDPGNGETDDSKATLTILDDDKITVIANRNIDTESTGLTADTISAGIVTAGIEEGHYTITVPMLPTNYVPSYSSDNNLTPLVTVEMTLPDAAGSTILPKGLGATLTLGGVEVGEVSFSNMANISDAAKLEGEYDTDTVMRFVIIADSSVTSQLRSGHYDFDVNFTAEPWPFPLTITRYRTIRGSTEIVNHAETDFEDDEFGTSWWIDGLDQLVLNDGVSASRTAGATASRLAVVGAATQTGAALIRGDGTSAWYAATSTKNDIAAQAFNKSAPGWKRGTHAGGNSAPYRYATGGLRSEEEKVHLDLFGLSKNKVYQLFTTWAPADTRASNAAFTISNAREVSSGIEDKIVLVDQRFTPGETVFNGQTWRSLGFYSPNDSELPPAPDGTEQDKITVTVSTMHLDADGQAIYANGQVVADTIIAVEDWEYTTPKGSFNKLEHGPFAGEEDNQDDYYKDSGYSPEDGQFTILTKHGSHYEFGKEGRLNAHQDRNKNRTLYLYEDSNDDDFDDRLLSITNVHGLTTTYEYDDSGYLESISDNTDVIAEFQISSGVVDSVNLPDPGNNQDQYSVLLGDHRFILEFDSGGPFRMTRVLGTNKERKVVVAHPDESTSTWELAPYRFDVGPTNDIRLPSEENIGANDEHAGELIVEQRAKWTDPNENVWTYQTDPFGLVTAMAKPKVTDEQDNVVHTDKVWIYKRDENGLLEEAIEPGGGGGDVTIEEALVTMYTYDDVDPEETKTRGNLTEVVYANGSSESWVYDDGTPKHFTTPNSYTDTGGRTTTYQHDDYGNVETVDQALGMKTHYTYTAPPTGGGIPGGLVEEVHRGYQSPEVAIDKYEYYDGGNQNGLVQVFTQALDSNVELKTYYDYDDRQNTTVVSNDPSAASGGSSLGAMERTTRYEYDNVNRLIKERVLADDQGTYAETEYTYYAGGNLKTVIAPHTGSESAANFTTEYEYNHLDQITRELMPAAGGNPNSSNAQPETIYEYDDNGNLEREKVSHSGGGYRETEHTYDERNQRTKTTYPAPGYSNTQAGITNNSESTQPVVVYTYDMLGNVINETDPRFGLNNSNPALTVYSYDKMHQVKSVTSPIPTGATAAPITTYDYKSDGQIWKVTTPSPGPAGSITTETVYDGLGRIDKVVYPSDGFGNVLTVDYEYDGRGNVKEVKESGADKSRTTATYYDRLDRTIAFDGPDGATDGSKPGTTTYYAYNDAGEVAATLIYATNVGASRVGDLKITLEEIDEQRDLIWPSPNNNIAQKTVYTYDNRGLVKEAVGPDPDRTGPQTGVKTTNTIDIRGNVEQTIVAFNENGVTKTLTTDYELDHYGRVWKTEAPATPTGRPETQVAYNVDGTILSQKVKNPNDNGPNGDTWSTTVYGYDGLGRVQTVKVDDSAAASGTVTSTTYRDALGNVTRAIDPFGLETKTTYDEAGVISQTSSRQPLVYVNDIARTDVDLQTAILYNTAGVARSQQRSAVSGGAVIATYGIGSLLSYDNFGRLRSTTEQLGGASVTTKFTYDVFGVRDSLTDGEGNVTNYDVDHLGRVTADRITVDGVELARNFSHDSFGNILTSNDRNNRDITYSYDNLGRRTKEEWGNSTGYIANYAYTALGELKEAKDAVSGVETSDYDYTYDSGRRIDQVTQTLVPLNYDQISFGYDYDLTGNVTSVEGDISNTFAFNSQERNYKNTYQFDNRGRVTEVKQTPFGSSDVSVKTIAFDHDYVTLTSSDTVITTTAKRYRGSATTPSTSSKRNINQRGVVTLTHHYEGDLPSSALGASATNAVESSTLSRDVLQHDPRGLIEGQATTSKWNSSTSTTTISNRYDDFGQLLQVDTDLPGSSDPPPSKFTYDSNGNRVGAGIVVGDANRLEQDGNEYLSYDAEGNVTRRWRYSEPVIGTATNDEQLWTGETSWIAGRYRLSFSGLRFEGDVDDFSRVNAAIYLSIDWASDPLLSTITDIDLTFDGTEWVAEEVDPAWLDIASDETGEIYVKFTYADGGVLNFDPNVVSGSIVRVTRVETLQVLTWDHRNRLSKVTTYSLYGDASQPTYPFTFEPTGQTLQLYKNATKDFIYDVNNRVIAETTHDLSTPGNIAVTTASVWERDQRVLLFEGDVVAANRLYMPGTDELLAVEVPSIIRPIWALTNHQGSLVGTYYENPDSGQSHLNFQPISYDSFGSPQLDKHSPAVGSLTQGELRKAIASFFTGREYDFDIALHYYRARWYDSLSGRFFSPDPIGFSSGDTNPYRYVFNSPANATDPSGTFIESAVDATSLGVGIWSLWDNLSEGNFGWALLDTVGIAADALALALPFVPGGVSLAIKGLRAGGVAIDSTQAVNASIHAYHAANSFSDILRWTDGGIGIYQTVDAYEQGNVLQAALGTAGLGIRGYQFQRTYAVSPAGFYSGFPINSFRRRTEVPQSRFFAESDTGKRLFNEAREYRSRLPGTAESKQYRNIAVADVVVDGDRRTVRFVNTPDIPGQQLGYHSEERLIQWFDALSNQQGKNVKVLSVFSDRLPCGRDRANCIGKLGDAFGMDINVFFAIYRGPFK